MRPWGGGAGRLAFTLAEALLTLLIISIVVALSTSVVAKVNKKLKANNMTHYWYCTRSSFDGEHVSGTNFDPSPGSHGANGCLFTPPKGAHKFNVTVIGGGGGGASGYSLLDNVQVFTRGKYTFRPHTSGQYYMILVGGGGGGGGHNWKCGNGDQGGRSGALIADYFELTKNTNYTLEVGEHGSGASGSHSGGSADSTTFSGGSLELVAGGGGGGRRRTPNFPWGCSNKGGGDPGKYSPRTVNGQDGYKDGGRYGGYILYDQFMEKYRNLEIANKLPSGYKNAGCGGRGLQSDGTDGCDGIALIQILWVYGGGGGQPGSVSFAQIKNPPEETLVVAGKGGKGAATMDTDGGSGTASRFGTKVLAAGGEGGNSRALAKNEFIIDGENGYKSMIPTNLVAEYTVSEIAAGGTYNTPGADASTPGAGGGGGGSNGQTGEWAAGGNGAPGIVIVVW